MGAQAPCRGAFGRKKGRLNFLSPGIVSIGSGGAYAQAAARALLTHSELSATEIVKQSLVIAGELCIYTNQNHTIEVLE